MKGLAVFISRAENRDCWCGFSEQKSEASWCVFLEQKTEAAWLDFIQQVWVRSSSTCFDLRLDLPINLFTIFG